MAGWHLDTKMAQDIVARTMRIIDTNINVMDARGRIIGSGDRERIGELHEGALLVLSQGRVVDIDDAVARHLHGVRQGINLPLRLEGEIVGVIGLTGEPENLRKYGELVCMTAEMMLEQSRLMHLLAQDSRLREELARPLARLKAMDNNGLLRRTLAAWFRHNVQPLATSKALFIHRNTLEYRLNRISELTGLDLGNFDDRLLLYVALQLDEER